MKRDDWVLIFALFGLLIASDQFTKAYALLSHLDQNALDLGPFKLTLVRNHAMMLGSFESLPRHLRVVGLSTLGTFIFIVYLTLQFLAPIKMYSMRVALTFLFGGFVGNVIDRIAYGSVIDFLTLSSPGSPIWNVADMYQWVGMVLFTYGLFRFRDIFWPVNERRGRKLIHVSFQRKFVLFFTGSILGFSLVAWVFAYTFIRTTFEMYTQQNQQFIREFMTSFGLSFAVVTICFSLFAGVFSLLYSHRIIGPIFALKRYFDDADAGKNYSFRLREFDELRELESLAARYQARAIPSRGAESLTHTEPPTQSSPKKPDQAA